MEQSTARSVRAMPRHRFAVLWIALMALCGETTIAADAHQPFQRFRDRPLEPGPDTEPYDPSADAEVLLGWFGPSDPQDPVWGPAWWAASRAVHEANEQGGFQGKPFRLVPTWSANPWGTGVASLFRLVYTRHPRLLIGSVDAPSTHLAEQVVAKARLPLISPVATDASVTLAGVPWTFALAPSDTQVAEVLVTDVLARLGGTDAAVWLINTTDHDSRQASRAVQAAWADRRRALQRHWQVPAETPPTFSQREILQSDPPHAIILIASADDSAAWVRALQAIHLPTALFGWHTMGRNRFLQQAGAVAEHVRFPLLGVRVTEDPRTALFREAARAKFGAPPDPVACFTYDATGLALEAIRRAGLERASICNALAGFSGRSGIAGPIRWDGTGQNTAARVTMATLIQGMPVLDLCELPSAPEASGPWTDTDLPVPSPYPLVPTQDRGYYRLKRLD